MFAFHPLFRPYERRQDVIAGAKNRSRSKTFETHSCDWTPEKDPPATGVTEGILGSVKGTDLVAVAFAPGRHGRVVACGPCSVEALLDGQAFEVVVVASD